MRLRNMLSVIKHILVIAAVASTAAHLSHASPQHSGAECYHNGHRLYVPDGLKYPRQAWANWGISCRAPEPDIAAGSGATAADGGERPEQWCGWWMRQPACFNCVGSAIAAGVSVPAPILDFGRSVLSSLG